MYLINKTVVIKKFLFENAKRSINSIEVMKVSAIWPHLPRGTSARLTALHFNLQKDWASKTSKGSANRPGEALNLQRSGWCEGRCAGFKSTNSEQVAMPPPAVPLHLWVASPIITALKEAPQRYWFISATPTPTPGQIQPGLAGGGRSQRDQLSTPQPLSQLPAMSCLQDVYSGN